MARPRSTAAPYRVGVDVGGTFTDFVLVRPDGSLELGKTATTPEDQSLGVMEGLARLAAGEGLATERFLERVSIIVHGTTTADNTMIEMNGAVTGLITSEGHRDEIELRRGYKEDIWDPALPPPPAIAPRRRRIGVPERLDFEGNVVTPLDEEAVRRALVRLRRLGTESLAVCLLFSFINPAHERRVAEIAREMFPDMHVSLSHEVMPAAPEFERTSTTLVDAFVAPRIRAYLDRLVVRLREGGFRGELLLMQSNGGLMPPAYVRSRPVTVLGSGPAGGVTAACRVAGEAGCREFVCADMGGTSYDVCLIRGGQPEVRAGWNWHHRYVIGLPMVDVQSIGAGGGSIAWVEAGALHVGPRSAGAVPGPICYGRGGTEPTVTDANLLLGFLDPEDFCGGAIRLRTDGVREAFEDRIARPLGLDVWSAAEGVYRLVNANMAHAIRRISADRGVDPRGLTMVAYGGNGPVHAAAQAAELGMPEVLVPRAAPAFSALGLLLSDHLVDELRTWIVPASSAHPARIHALMDEMEGAVRSVLERSRGTWRRIELRWYARMCYPGQTFDMAVPLVTRRGRVDRHCLDRTVERFHEMHEELHTYASRDEEPILRGLRLTGVGVTDKPALPRPAGSRRPPLPWKWRRVRFAGRFRRTPIYDGRAFLAGQRVEGPAVIQEPFTTIVVHPGQVARLDRRGNYRIRLRG